jgi:hypothetical protein
MIINAYAAWLQLRLTSSPSSSGPMAGVHIWLRLSHVKPLERVDRCTGCCRRRGSWDLASGAEGTSALAPRSKAARGNRPIGAAGDLHDRRLHPSADPDSSTEQAIWTRIQDGRSALHLLCTTSTVETTEALVTGVRHTRPKTGDGSQEDETITLLRDLVQRLRHELDAGTG